MLSEAPRAFVIAGTLAMAAAVALGAFGAHALRARVTPEDLAIWQTAVLYHLVHALGLLAVAWLCSVIPAATGVRWAGWTMLGGIVLFSGSLYALVLTGTRMLGAVTPLGGVAFLAAWITLAVAVWRH